MPKVLKKYKLTFDKLVKAYFDCRKRKRNTINALQFEFNLEENLLKLYEELKNGTYQIGRSICFMVLEPKPREVWAADFRDRIVHHLIYNAISPLFYNKFITDTYSCIPKRGSLNAAKKIEKYAKIVTQNYTKQAYYLKADIKNFFVSIDRDILLYELAKYVKVPWLLKLLKSVIYNDCRINCIIQSSKRKFLLIPSYKSLWHTPPNKGLPIGNLTSQFFSNVYLNVLDQYIKNHHHCKFYCRYVDDFIILDPDPRKLNKIHKDLTKFLKASLKIELHQYKKEINKVELGADFVGFVIKPRRTILRQKTLRKVNRIIEEYKQNPKFYTRENVTGFIHSMNSYLGIMRCTSGYKMRKKICGECVNLFVNCDKDYRKLINSGA